MGEGGRVPPWGRAGCPVLAPGRLAGTCGRSRLEGARPGMQTQAGRAREASGALDPRPDSRLLETWVSLGAGRPGGPQSRMSVSKGTRW